MGCFGDALTRNCRSDDSTTRSESREDIFVSIGLASDTCIPSPPQVNASPHGAGPWGFADPGKVPCPGRMSAYYLIGADIQGQVAAHASWEETVAGFEGGW
jgi:hypothetical protein